jgi:polygalacturonase
MSIIDPRTVEIAVQDKLRVLRRRIVGKSVRAPFKMPPVAKPRFPRRVVDIRDHGAVADGTTFCTEAISQAICACAKAGGGRVLIPAGEWLSGAIHLQSNVDLHVAEGAVLRFSDIPEHYLPPVFVRWGGQECYNYSPFIYARDCSNIAVSGSGRLTGQGNRWWAWKENENEARDRLNQMVADQTPVERRRFASEEFPLRPQFICAINCDKVLLEDFSIEKGVPYWTVQLAYCRDVLVRRLNICADEAPNNEGIVIDSSRNVVVEDCQIHTRDDCIVLKSGLNEDGWRVARATENIIIRRIRATGGFGGFAIGSEIASPIRNVFVHDCRWDRVAAGIRIKVPRARGGPVEDIYVQDIAMDDISGDAIQMTVHETAYMKSDGKALSIRNVQIRNITCVRANTAVRLIGIPDAPFREIMLENLTISADEGLFCVASKGLRLLNLQITPRNGPVLSVRDSQNVIIDGLSSVQSRGVFLDLRGHQVQDVRLRGEINPANRPVVLLGIDVPKDAIVQE